MFDCLEGLDYKPGECSCYVSKVLRDIKTSKDNGDLVKIPADEVRIGDVIVEGYRSFLVTEDYFPRSPIKPEDIRRSPEGKLLEPYMLVIPDKVLRRLQSEDVAKS